MREMKDSGIEWIRKVPYSWKLIPIRYLVGDCFSGSWGDDPQNNENDLECLRIADFDFDKLTFKSNIEYTRRNYSLTDIVTKALKYGDLCIEKSGGGDKTPVGRTVVYRGCSPVLFANFMNCIRLNPLCHIEFGKYLFAISYYNDVTRLYFNQTTGIQNLNIPKYFREVSFPIPPIQEQKRIASFLDSKCAEIDFITADILKEIETLQEYRKSVITEAVTITDFNAVKTIPLKYIATCNDDTLKDDTLPDFDFDYIEIGNVIYGKGIIGYEHCSFKDAPSRARRIVKTGDVIVSTVRTYLKAISQIPKSLDGQIVSTGFAVIRPKHINSQFLMYSLLSNDFVSEIEARSTGVSYPAINSSEVMKVKIVVPSIDKQKHIASYLDARCFEIDSIIENKQKQIDTLAEYRKSLIYEYVTGKKEVPAV